MPERQLPQAFLAGLPADLRTRFSGLRNPVLIQELLDDIPYVSEDLNRTPLRVLQDWQCHCLDGGMLAALALRQLGCPPLLIDLTPVPDLDDDHVLAVFQVNGLWGSVAKSNFTGLRYRDPVYRSLRELVMSYFEVFFNSKGEKTLRGYTRPFNLTRFDALNWTWDQAGTDKAVAAFYNRPAISLIPPANLSHIADLDSRSFANGFMGVNRDGLFKVGD